MDNDFKNCILAMGEQISKFTTVDLKPLRPNACDKQLTNDI
jgi:hypothetical protein